MHEGRFGAGAAAVFPAGYKRFQPVQPGMDNGHLLPDKVFQQQGGCVHLVVVYLVGVAAEKHGRLDMQRLCQPGDKAGGRKLRAGFDDGQMFLGYFQLF